MYGVKQSILPVTKYARIYKTYDESPVYETKNPEEESRSASENLLKSSLTGRLKFDLEKQMQPSIPGLSTKLCAHTEQPHSNADRTHGLNSPRRGKFRRTDAFRKNETSEGWRLALNPFCYYPNQPAIVEKQVKILLFLQFL